MLFKKYHNKAVGKSCEEIYGKNCTKMREIKKQLCEFSWNCRQKGFPADSEKVCLLYYCKNNFEE